MSSGAISDRAIASCDQNRGCHGERYTLDQSVGDAITRSRQRRDTDARTIGAGAAFRFAKLMWASTLFSGRGAHATSVNMMRRISSGRTWMGAMSALSSALFAWMRSMEASARRTLWIISRVSGCSSCTCFSGSISLCSVLWEVINALSVSCYGDVSPSDVAHTKRPLHTLYLGSARIWWMRDPRYACSSTALRPSSLITFLISVLCFERIYGLRLRLQRGATMYPTTYYLKRRCRGWRVLEA